MKKVKCWRQGDVFICETPGSTPVGAPVPRDKGRVVLAYGELTGHAHAIAAPAAKLYELATPATDEELRSLGERILRSTTAFTLKHEEHAQIKLPAGTYRVIHQREYSPEALRSVAD